MKVAGRRLSAWCGGTLLGRPWRRCTNNPNVSERIANDNSLVERTGRSSQLVLSRGRKKGTYSPSGRGGRGAEDK